MEKAEKDTGTLEAKVEKDLLFSRLKSLIRAISKVPDLEVVDTLTAEERAYFKQTGKSTDTAWFFSPKDRKVHIPSEMANIPQIEALGKASHEAAHVAITRITELAPDSFMRHLGMSSLALAVEERPTDQYVRRYTPGAGKWLDAARLASVTASTSQEQGKDSLPKFLQLCNLFVYGRFDEKLKDTVDQDVWDTYAKLKDTLTNIEENLPSEDATEEEVVDRARERFENTCTSIIPHIDTLIEHDIKHEQAKRAIHDDDLIEKLMRLLSEELQKELQKITAERKPVKSTEEPAPDDSGEAKVEALGEGSATEGEPTIALPAKVDVNASKFAKPSPELLKKIMELLDSLPKDIQDALRSGAEKDLRTLEDKMVKELKGKIEDTKSKAPRPKEPIEPQKPPTAESISYDEHERPREESIVLSKADERELAQYERSYQKVHGHTESLFKRLDDIFHPNIKRGMQLRSAGAKINLPAVFRHTAQRQSGAQTIDNKIFEVTRFPEPKDYAVTVLIDLSGSMRNGDKIEAAYAGVIMLAEALSRIGIKFEIIGFQDNTIIFKDFDVPFSDSIRARMPGIVYEVRGTHEGGNNSPNFNDDGPCLLEASDRLAATGAKSKVLLVISDGTPEGRRSNESDLREAIDHVKTRTDQHLAALGLGGGTEHVEHFYKKNGLANVPIENMTEKLGDLLYNLIENPDAFT